MSKIQIELNRQGVGELLKSVEMQEGLATLSAEIQARCGEGYGTDIYNAGTRVIASVYTEDKEAIQDNLDNNTLLQALGG